jgi:polyhydroxybutyrate depolymerase
MGRPANSRLILGARTVGVAALVALGPLLVGLGPSAEPAGATTGASATSSSGCGTAVSPGTRTLNLSIGGRVRTVIVHVPPAASAKRALPLVLNMHGSESDALEQEAITGMDAAADADSFIVAYPQAAIAAGSGFDWNVPNEPLIGGALPPAGSPNDVAFLVKLPGVLGQRYCINPERVYATGFSGGARMASQLGCDAPNVFAAIAPVSGLRLPTPCPGTRPVPVAAFHGTGDPVDPYDGNGQAYWTYSVPVAAAKWGAHDHCAAVPTVTSAAVGVSLTAYRGCADGVVVELYTITGEGHEWPGGPHLRRALTRVLGPQTTAIDADQVMWRFFAAHPLAPRRFSSGG